MTTVLRIRCAESALSAELGKVPGINKFEEINLHIEVKFCRCKTGDEWGTLDVVLATGFPMLKQVSIYIILYDLDGIQVGLKKRLDRPPEVVYQFNSILQFLDQNPSHGLGCHTREYIESTVMRNNYQQILVELVSFSEFSFKANTLPFPWALLHTDFEYYIFQCIVLSRCMSQLPPEILLSIFPRAIPPYALLETAHLALLVKSIAIECHLSTFAYDSVSGLSNPHHGLSSLYA